MTDAGVTSSWSVVVLTGGRGSRLGAFPKPDITVGGTTLLDHVLASLPSDVHVVACGPACDASRPVILCREDPPFGGPLAGLAAALNHVPTEVVVVLAGDMPGAGRLASELASACMHSTADAVLAVDAAGRRQPLAGAYRTAAAARALAAISPVAGQPFHRLLDTLVIEEWHEPGVSDLLNDIDTRDDLQRARARQKGRAHMLQDWVLAVKAELGLTADIDVDELLDVARVAAHNVERPAAPLTTYLMGLAVGSGQDAHAVALALQHLAERWSTDE